VTVSYTAEDGILRRNVFWKCLKRTARLGKRCDRKVRQPDPSFEIMKMNFKSRHNFFRTLTQSACNSTQKVFHTWRFVISMPFGMLIVAYPLQQCTKLDSVPKRQVYKLDMTTQSAKEKRYPRNRPWRPIGL
jgi:hypothetical protein